MSQRLRFSRLAYLAYLLLSAWQLAAQTPPSRAVIVSPEVLQDRRVIFRFYAPKAQDVNVVFERGGQGLTKTADGVWQAAHGPVDPGSYRYGFSVDGASVTDPRNIETERMQVVTRSILHVPGAMFMDTTNVPHGAVAVATYYSGVLKKFRRFMEHCGQSRFHSG